MKRISLMLVMLLMLSGITWSQERGGGKRPSTTTQERGGGQRPSANGQQGRAGNRGDFQRMTPEQRLQRQTQMLVEQLKLNKDQEQKVTAINKKYAEKQNFDWSKMRDASDDERAKMRENMMKVQAEKDKEIKTVLTPDQVKLYDDMLKKRQEMMRNGQGRRGGGGQGNN
jgi:Spy/CpxP family protein refolding chaperone